MRLSLPCLLFSSPFSPPRLSASTQSKKGRPSESMQALRKIKCCSPLGLLACDRASPQSLMESSRQPWTILNAACMPALFQDALAAPDEAMNASARVGAGGHLRPLRRTSNAPGATGRHAAAVWQLSLRHHMVGGRPLLASLGSGQQESCQAQPYKSCSNPPHPVGATGSRVCRQARSFCSQSEGGHPQSDALKGLDGEAARLIEECPAARGEELKSMCWPEVSGSDLEGEAEKRQYRGAEEKKVGRSGVPRWHQALQGDPLAAKGLPEAHRLYHNSPLVRPQDRQQLAYGWPRLGALLQRRGLSSRHSTCAGAKATPTVRY